MVCPQCGTQNDEDGRFCKQCGKPLPRPSKMTWAQVEAKVEQLVQEAFECYQQERYEDALLACEGVLALDAENTSAWSLKGFIYEKKGQPDLAIEAFEQVVKLNPYSVADRAKLEALKGQHAPTLPATAPSWKAQWLIEIIPALVAAGIAALMLVLGLWLTFRWSNEPRKGAVSQPPAQVAPAPSTSPVGATPPASPPSQSLSSQRPPSQPPSSVPPLTVDPSRLALLPQEESRPPSPRGAGQPSTQPSAPSAPSPTPTDATQPERKGTVIMPDVNVESEGDKQAVYDIRVSRRPASPERETAQPENAEVYLQMAREYQMAGQLSEAIAAYEKALPLVSNGGDLHLQIALCYFRLGEKQRAAQHYQKAIEQYEILIRQGKEVKRAREAIRTCETGLALCKE